MEELVKLYTAYFGCAPSQSLEIVNSGSSRRYFRMSDAQHSAIGVQGTSLLENEAFIAISAAFIKKEIPVPRVLNVSRDRYFYLTEDLGNTALADLLPNPDDALLEQVVRDLVRIQFEGGSELDYKVCYPQPCFDRRTIFWDLNYFKYNFVKPTGLEFNEALLEDDFERLCTRLLAVDTHTFMYRDFQSRNIMVQNGTPKYIDFQGGRKGPFYYDLASLLYQAKARFTQSTKNHLIAVYRQALEPYYKVDETCFNQTFGYFVLFRCLQTLGAYGFRGLVEHKAHFVQSIPLALEAIGELPKHFSYPDLPYLSELVGQLSALKERYQGPQNNEKLIVRVGSFSYKKGLPQDYSGNGGGFVFDCRAMHNPGRYDAYKNLTGRDQVVIQYLEEQGEIQDFLQHAYALTDHAVERYLKRGFSSLCVFFGCTGGRHRSVYSAQHMAEHLAQKFGVEVHLEHRELAITQTL